MMRFLKPFLRALLWIVLAQIVSAVILRHVDTSSASLMANQPEQRNRAAVLIGAWVLTRAVIPIAALTRAFDQFLRNEKQLGS